MTDWRDVLYKICDHQGWTVFESSNEWGGKYLHIRIYDKSNCPIRAHGSQHAGISALISMKESEANRNEMMRQFVEFMISGVQLMSDSCPDGYPIVPRGDSWEEIRMKMEITNG